MRLSICHICQRLEQLWTQTLHMFIWKLYGVKLSHGDLPWERKNLLSLVVFVTIYTAFQWCHNLLSCNSQDRTCDPLWNQMQRHCPIFCTRHHNGQSTAQGDWVPGSHHSPTSTDTGCKFPAWRSLFSFASVVWPETTSHVLPPQTHEIHVKGI